MKRFLLLFALAGGVTTAAVAQQKAAAPKDKKAIEAVPMFKFEKGDVHDFGVVKEGAPAVYVFEFKNVGKAPLIIQNASASCGCTTPEWSKEPILPGKKGKVTVSYSTQGRVGPIDKTVWIQSNAALPESMKAGGRYELKIKGEVKPAGTAATTPKS
jgi:hypothetical protein